MVEPPLPRWRRVFTAAVPLLASFILLWHFIATGSLHRQAGIGYDPTAYLLADWGELAMVRKPRIPFGAMCVLRVAALE